VQTAIHKDVSGLKVLWDERKQCYCFEDAHGELQRFTLSLTTQDMDTAANGYNGPTIEALFAIIKHQIDKANQGEAKCLEYDRTSYSADLGIWNLQQRNRRQLADIACAT
jgi:hypothetical protein